jgi:hypothetical protein
MEWKTEKRGSIPGRVQTGYGVHPASYRMGIGDRFAETSGQEADHSSHLVPRLRMVELHGRICLPHASMMVSCSAYIDPEDGSDMFLRRQLTFNGLRSVISQCSS